MKDTPSFFHRPIGRALVFCAFLLAFLAFYNDIAPISFQGEAAGDSAFNPSEEMFVSSKRIDEAGAPEAYAEFVSRYKESPYEVQHMAAHLMGTLLYEKLGIGGLAICDGSFAFGCYHQFFTDAIAERGVDIIPELDRTCVDAFGPFGSGCQHGIGHGLVEHFGYENEDLLKELSFCSMTTTINEYFGCTSGVFMQYHLPTAFDGEEVRTEVRQFDEEAPGAPCSTFVPDAFKKACYFSLAQWWFALFPGAYERIGSFCAPHGPYREACYLGVGDTLAHAEHYDPEALERACAAMPEREAEILCRAGASWGIFAEPSEREHAGALCNSLGDNEREVCMERADLIGNGEITRIFGEQK